MVPDADVGIILSGTGSERAFIQRLGRSLRKKEGKEAVLYEIVSAVGLQKGVEPYYCLLQPNTVVNGINVCAATTPILPFTIATPQGTVIP